VEDVQAVLKEERRGGDVSGGLTGSFLGEEGERGGGMGWDGEANGVLFLDVELEVDGAGAGGGYAELWR
jgi:hypothetical protein